MSALADAVPSRAALFRTLHDGGPFLDRLCRLAADSAYLWQMLLQHMEYLDLLADEETLDQPPPPPPPGSLSSAAALATAARRTRLQTGVRDIWGLAATPQILTEVTQAAEWAMAETLTLAARHENWTGRLAVIGLGKLGGQEMGYASDLDVLFVSDTEHVAEATRLAERVQRILSDEMTRHGFRYEVDARLRPDGRKGALVLDLPSYRRYYAESAATWERHALLKARPMAGDRELGREFARLAEEVVYGRPWTDAEVQEVQAMKRRIEAERLKNPRDLKLAPGGLADIEWTAQLLQLRHGPQHRRLRTPGTLAALHALRDDALITQADWEILSNAYIGLVRTRNRLYLRSGVPVDTPGALPPDLAAQMAAAREVVTRRFYAAPPA